MTDAILLLEIEAMERALKAARSYRTTLAGLRTDDTSRHLMRAAEAQIQALCERLRAARYLLRHPVEVRT